MVNGGSKNMIEWEKDKENDHLKFDFFSSHLPIFLALKLFEVKCFHAFRMFFFLIHKQKQLRNTFEKVHVRDSESPKTILTSFNSDAESYSNSNKIRVLSRAHLTPSPLRLDHHSTLPVWIYVPTQTHRPIDTHTHIFPHIWIHIVNNASVCLCKQVRQTPLGILLLPVSLQGIDTTLTSVQFKIELGLCTRR